MKLLRRKQNRRQNQLNRAMGDLAQTFLETCRKRRLQLELSVESAHRLDAVIDELLAGEPSTALEQAVAQGAAAYFGEVVIGAGKAVWALEPGTEDVVLAMLPDGVPAIYLVTVIDKRIALGTTSDLSTLLDECLAGFTRPGDAQPS